MIENSGNWLRRTFSTRISRNGVNFHSGDDVSRDIRVLQERVAFIIADFTDFTTLECLPNAEMRSKFSGAEVDEGLRKGTTYRSHPEEESKLKISSRSLNITSYIFQGTPLDDDSMPALPDSDSSRRTAIFSFFQGRFISVHASLSREFPPYVSHHGEFCRLS